MIAQTERLDKSQDKPEEKECKLVIGAMVISYYVAESFCSKTRDGGKTLHCSVSPCRYSGLRRPLPKIYLESSHLPFISEMCNLFAMGAMCMHAAGEHQQRHPRHHLPHVTCPSQTDYGNPYNGGPSAWKGAGQPGPAGMMR